MQAAKGSARTPLGPIVATFVYASSQGQLTHSARTNLFQWPSHTSDQISVYSYWKILSRFCQISFNYISRKFKEKYTLNLITAFFLSCVCNFLQIKTIFATEKKVGDYMAAAWPQFRKRSLFRLHQPTTTKATILRWGTPTLKCLWFFL